MHRLAAFFSRVVWTLLISAWGGSEVLRQRLCLTRGEWTVSLDHLCVYRRRFFSDSVYQSPCRYQFALHGVQGHPQINRVAASRKGLELLKLAGHIIHSVFGNIRGFLALQRIVPSFAQLAQASLLICPEWVNAGRRILLATIRSKMGMCRLPGAKYFVAVEAAPRLPRAHACTPVGAIRRAYVSRLPTTASMNESSRCRVWRFTSPSFNRHANSSMYRERCLAEA